MIDYNALFTQIPSDLRNTKGRGIKVAILDSGINLNHIAFKGKSINIDEENSTRVSIKDTTGHGTHIAGIIAANCEEFMGLAPESELYISKIVSNDRGIYSTDLLIKGLKWAIRTAKVDVINLSFTIPSVATNPEVLGLLNEALAKNITLIASAGENSILKASRPAFFYPAMLDQCIAIGGISPIFLENSTNPVFSNKLDFIFPKLYIHSCSHIKSEYDDKVGSSMSTGFVSALVCLIKSSSADPKSMGIETIKEKLDEIAKPFNSTSDLKNNALRIFKL